MTVCWDSRRGSATRLHDSGFSAPAFFPSPVGLGRGAQPKTDQGERLSEALAEFELDPVFGEHRRSPRSEAEGTQTIGSPFLLLTFLLATQKKSELPRGNPRPTDACKLQHPGIHPSTGLNSPLPAGQEKGASYFSRDGPGKKNGPQEPKFLRAKHPKETLAISIYCRSCQATAACTGFSGCRRFRRAK